jgi:hypothetical protein
VLHTWTRALLYHPHVHLLVSAGGLSADGQQWMPAKNPAFLVPCFALSKIFAGKFKAGLKGLNLIRALPASVWQGQWVVHCRHAGSGQKVLEYLGRYVFRTAITNSRIEAFANGQVTFRYRDNRSQLMQHLSLNVEEFIGRFLRHVLPKGFVKVRSYGLWSAQGGAKLEKARALLALSLPSCSSAQAQDPALELSLQTCVSARSPQICPHCKQGLLIWIRKLLPQRTRGP